MKNLTPEEARRLVEKFSEGLGQDLLNLTGQVNSGEKSNVIDVVGCLRNHDSCSSCNGRTKVELHANSRGIWVGECPHCGCVIFYVSLPYHACGKMGPYPLAYRENFKFYYRIEHLGDLYVEIQKDE